MNIDESVCSNVSFTNSVALSSMDVNWIAFNDFVCISIEMPRVGGWMAFGFGRSNSMVSDPPTNIVMTTSGEMAKVFTVTSKSAAGIVPQNGVSSIRIVESTSRNGITRIVFLRLYASVSEFDVPIDPRGNNHIIWAYGENYPEIHAEGNYGFAEMNFLSTRPATSFQNVDQLASKNTSTPLISNECGDFTSAFSAQLSSMILKWVPSSDFICFSLEASGGEGWLSFGFSRSHDMVSNPMTNIILSKIGEVARVYTVSSKSSSGIVEQVEPSSTTILETNYNNDHTKIIFSRKYAAVSKYDVEIDPAGGNYAIWALGSNYPSKHSVGNYGSFMLNLTEGSISDMSKNANTNYITIIAAIGLGILLFIGVVSNAKFFLKSSLSQRFIYAKIGKPPETKGYLSLIGVDPRRSFLDLRWGELGLYFLYFIGNGIIALYSYVKLSNLKGSDQEVGALVTGHLSIVNLALLLLPITRWNILNVVFNTCFTTMIKFHRFIGSCTIVIMVIHFCFSLNICDSIFSSEKCSNGQVIPLYGTLALLGFASMGLLSNEYIRRNTFELFYYYHRVVSVISLAFASLHSTKCILILLLPLSLYILGFLERLTSLIRRYPCSKVLTKGDLSIIEIYTDSRLREELHDMKFGAYFFLCVPAISKLEWHPFSIMARGPANRTVTLAIKGLGSHTFTGKLHELCSSGKTFEVLLDGPMRTMSIPVDMIMMSDTSQKLDTIILVAGGIGVTPFVPILHAVRQRFRTDVRIVFVWVVKHPANFLDLDTYIFPTTDEGWIKDGHCIAMHLYASRAGNNGRITTSSHENINFTSGYPDIIGIFTQVAADSGRVGVLASGPYGLVASAQRAADVMGLDFHKEIFEW